MKFDLIRPCADCPFRTDTQFHFRPGRAEEIVRSVVEGDLTFPCHKTIHGRGRKRRRIDRQMCAGALILHEKLGKPNWRIRYAHALGLYDPSRLVMASPVVESIEQFVAIQSEGGQ